MRETTSILAWTLKLIKLSYKHKDNLIVGN